MIKTINFCQNKCIKAERILESHDLTEFEKQCGKNCLRKHDKAYKLFESVQDRLTSAYLQDLNIDEESLQREILKEEKRKLRQEFSEEEKERIIEEADIETEQQIRRQ